MDYKEKYEQALERASKLRVQNPFDTVGQMVEHIFPDLQESEDERIRKSIISILKGEIRYISIEDTDKYVTWLENQGKLDNNDTNILNRFSFYSYKDEPNILYLSELYVNKEQRNKGIGTKILKIADKVAASMKCNLIRLKTEIGSNAERLYRKNGYNSLMMEGNQVWLEKQGDKDKLIKEYEKYINWLEKQGERKSSDFSDIRIWKYIVDMVLTEQNGIGQYLDNPDTERIAKKLQEKYGNIDKEIEL